MEKVLFYFAMVYQGDWDLIYRAIKNLEEINEEKIQQYQKELKSNYLTLLSPLYPERLKQIDKPPFVLFYYGDINLIRQEKIIGVVGSRYRTSFGMEKATEITKELVFNDYIIVSGMAKGIDSDAHKASLSTRKKSTIAVLGFGIDYCYPSDAKELKEKLSETELIISEYPGELKPHKRYFPFRNRIIAGLSIGIAVIECKPISGASITVSYALDFGKDVFAVPTISKVHNGTNLFIKQGAILIENAFDIITYYGK